MSPAASRFKPSLGVTVQSALSTLRTPTGNLRRLMSPEFHDFKKIKSPWQYKIMRVGESPER